MGHVLENHGNPLENHGNPRKFWEKNGKCAGKSWKSQEILGEEWEMCWKIMEILGNPCAGKSWKS